MVSSCVKGRKGYQQEGAEYAGVRKEQKGEDQKIWIGQVREGMKEYQVAKAWDMISLANESSVAIVFTH